MSNCGALVTHHHKRNGPCMCGQPWKFDTKARDLPCVSAYQSSCILLQVAICNAKYLAANYYKLDNQVAIVKTSSTLLLALRWKNGTT